MGDKEQTKDLSISQKEIDKIMLKKFE